MVKKQNNRNDLDHAIKPCRIDDVEDVSFNKRRPAEHNRLSFSETERR